MIQIGQNIVNAVILQIPLSNTDIGPGVTLK